MAEAAVFSADVRERAGKGVARAHRRMGRIPAVIYGNKMEPVMIALDGKELSRHLHNPGFFTTVIEVDVNGEIHKVLARDVQFDLTEGRVSAQAASLYAARNDAIDLAEKILELIDDEARRVCMGEFGRRRVQDELAWEFEAPKLIEAYEAARGVRD